MYRNKKQAIEGLNNNNNGLTPISIYNESHYNIGNYTLLWSVGGEIRLTKHRQQKSILYQRNIPNEQGEFPIIKITVEKKTVKRGLFYTVTDISYQ